MEDLFGEQMINLVRKILERTNVLKERANRLSDKLGDTPEGRFLKGLKMSELSDFEMMSYPESSVIAMTDWYYSRRSKGIEEKDIFEEIIAMRKMCQKDFGSKKIVQKLKNFSIEQFQSLPEFVRKVAEIEHDISLSPEEIGRLISEYKNIRKVK